MTEQLLFITENKQILPTLEKIHPDQVKNMKELCKEMESLIDQTNKNVNQMLKSQQNNILNAFKQVLENMKKDIDQINEKFHQYVEFNDKESQVIDAQNKMYNIQTLTKSNKFLENELMFTKEALLKQVWKNEKLKQTLQKFKEQQYENQDVRNYHLKLLPTEPLMLQDYQYDQINFASVRKARFDSTHKKHSFNSIANSDTKSKFILSQQTRAQSLQKSIVAKRSAVFETSILDKSQQQDQIFEYNRYQSLKQDNDNNQ